MKKVIIFMMLKYEGNKLLWEQKIVNIITYVINREIVFNNNENSRVIFKIHEKSVRKYQKYNQMKYT